jgi:polysaccharide biosynthesis/export protein
MIVRLICMFVAIVFAANSGAGAAPNDLAKYVLEARRVGLSDQEIAQNAAKAGWSAPVIAEAITAAHEAPGQAVVPEHPAEATEPANTEGPKKQEPPPPQNAPASPAASPTTENHTADQAAKAAGNTPLVNSALVDRGVPDDYVIGEGDILHISVWKEPDTSVPSVVVRPDGRISMPMLKEVKVAGLTPVEAEKLITEGLSHFISTADVTVIVSNINSKKVYFVGGVKKEEPIPYVYRMTVLQGLSEAGGLTDYAKKKKIYVLRHQNGKDYRLPFDYDAVVKGQKMQMNILLLPGDTVVVPR